MWCWRISSLARKFFGTRPEANNRQVNVDWANCGLCVDERGVNEAISGTRRGGSPDLGKFINASPNTAVVPTGG